MGKEVRTYLGNLDPSSRYFPFIRERNGSIAEKIARHQGLPFNPNPIMQGIENKTYVVPGATLTSGQADQLLIAAENDFYGTAAPTMDHVGKSILHRSMSERYPGFYSPEFAQEAESMGLVLPGYTGFAKEEIQQAFMCVDSRPLLYRLKVPNESDGNGQYRINDTEHLVSLLSQIDAESIAQHGMVIEPDLRNKSTVSVGHFALGDDSYSFVANQTGEMIDGRDVYLGGNDIIVARGELQNLMDMLHQLGDERFESVAKGKAFFQLYAKHYPLLSSRMSVDVLSGSHPDFGQISGVTDITGRLGGLCPATTLAALHLQENPHQAAVGAQVNLNYTPQVRQEYERGATVFMDQAPLRITAKIDKVY